METRTKSHNSLQKGPLRISRTVGVLGGWKQELVWGRILNNVLCIFKDSQEATSLLRINLDPDNLRVTFNPKVHKFRFLSLEDRRTHFVSKHPKLTQEQRERTISLSFHNPPNTCTNVVMLFFETEEHAAAWKVALSRALVRFSFVSSLNLPSVLTLFASEKSFAF